MSGHDVRVLVRAGIAIVLFTALVSQAKSCVDDRRHDCVTSGGKFYDMACHMNGDR